MLPKHHVHAVSNTAAANLIDSDGPNNNIDSDGTVTGNLNVVTESVDLVPAVYNHPVPGLIGGNHHDSALDHSSSSYLRQGSGDNDVGDMYNRYTIKRGCKLCFWGLVFGVLPGLITCWLVLLIPRDRNILIEVKLNHVNNLNVQNYLKNLNVDAESDDFDPSSDSLEADQICTYSAQLVLDSSDSESDSKSEDDDERKNSCLEDSPQSPLGDVVNRCGIQKQTDKKFSYISTFLSIPPSLVRCAMTSIIYATFFLGLSAVRSPGLQMPSFGRIMWGKVDQKMTLSNTSRIPQQQSFKKFNPLDRQHLTDQQIQDFLLPLARWLFYKWITLFTLGFILAYVFDMSPIDQPAELRWIINATSALDHWIIPFCNWRKIVDNSYGRDWIDLRIEEIKKQYGIKVHGDRESNRDSNSSISNDKLKQLILDSNKKDSNCIPSLAQFFLLNHAKLHCSRKFMLYIHPFILLCHIGLVTGEPWWLGAFALGMFILIIFVLEIGIYFANKDQVKWEKQAFKSDFEIGESLEILGLNLLQQNNSDHMMGLQQLSLTQSSRSQQDSLKLPSKSILKATTSDTTGIDNSEANLQQQQAQQVQQPESGNISPSLISSNSAKQVAIFSHLPSDGPGSGPGVSVIGNTNSVETSLTNQKSIISVNNYTDDEINQNMKFNNAKAQNAQNAQSKGGQSSKTGFVVNSQMSLISAPSAALTDSSLQGTNANTQHNSTSFTNHTVNQNVNDNLPDPLFLKDLISDHDSPHSWITSGMMMVALWYAGFDTIIVRVFDTIIGLAYGNNTTGTGSTFLVYYRFFAWQIGGGVCGFLLQKAIGRCRVGLKNRRHIPLVTLLLMPIYVCVGAASAVEVFRLGPLRVEFYVAAGMVCIWEFYRDTYFYFHLTYIMGWDQRDYSSGVFFGAEDLEITNANGIDELPKDELNNFIHTMGVGSINTTNKLNMKIKAQQNTMGVVMQNQQSQQLGYGMNVITESTRTIGINQSSLGSSNPRQQYNSNRDKWNTNFNPAKIQQTIAKDRQTDQNEASQGSTASPVYSNLEEQDHNTLNSIFNFFNFVSSDFGSRNSNIDGSTLSKLSLTPRSRRSKTQTQSKSHGSDSNRKSPPNSNNDQTGKAVSASGIPGSNTVMQLPKHNNNNIDGFGIANSMSTSYSANSKVSKSKQILTQQHSSSGASGSPLHTNTSTKGAGQQSSSIQLVTRKANSNASGSHKVVQSVSGPNVSNLANMISSDESIITGTNTQTSKVNTQSQTLTLQSELISDDMDYNDNVDSQNSLESDRLMDQYITISNRKTRFIHIEIVLWTLMTGISEVLGSTCLLIFVLLEFILTRLSFFPIATLFFNDSEVGGVRKNWESMWGKDSIDRSAEIMGERIKESIGKYQQGITTSESSFSTPTSNSNLNLLNPGPENLYYHYPPYGIDREPRWGILLFDTKRGTSDNSFRGANLHPDYCDYEQGWLSQQLQSDSQQIIPFKKLNPIPQFPTPLLEPISEFLIHLLGLIMYISLQQISRKRAVEISENLLIERLPPESILLGVIVLFPIARKEFMQLFPQIVGTADNKAQKRRSQTTNTNRLSQQQSRQSQSITSYQQYKRVSANCNIGNTNKSNNDSFQFVHDYEWEEAISRARNMALDTFLTSGKNSQVSLIENSSGPGPNQTVTESLTTDQIQNQNQGQGTGAGGGFSTELSSFAYNPRDKNGPQNTNRVSSSMNFNIMNSRGQLLQRFQRNVIELPIQRILNRRQSTGGLNSDSEIQSVITGVTHQQSSTNTRLSRVFNLDIDDNGNETCSQTDTNMKNNNKFKTDKSGKKESLQIRIKRLLDFVSRAYFSQINLIGLNMEEISMILTFFFIQDKLAPTLEVVYGTAPGEKHNNG